MNSTEEKYIRKKRQFVKDYNGSINEIPQNAGRITEKEAQQLFEDHTNEGDEKVLIPRPETLEIFQKMKSQEYNQFGD